MPKLKFNEKKHQYFLDDIPIPSVSEIIKPIYDKIIYERNLSVNTAILKGRIYKNPTSFGESVHFTLEVSGGKDPKTNEWRKPIYADCTAFGELHSFIFWFVV